MSVCKREIASRLCESASAVGAGGLLLTMMVVDALSKRMSLYERTADV